MKHKGGVSILIKAFNEEAQIASCLAAAVREAQSVGGEVILVDSLSTDRTVEIARSYPVRIVQFSFLEDRGCGAAVQLGYQFSKGEYIYVLDGDMELQTGFIAKALAVLNTEPDVAGIGGKLLDTHIRNAMDLKRAETVGSVNSRAEVDALGGGALYRRDAIESVGYLAHRWLPAFEEAELGFRLRAAGWRLLRLPDVAVLHTGHAESSWGMLRRLWMNRRAHASGMFLRAALGKAWWWRVVRYQWSVVLTSGIHLMVLGMAILLGTNLLDTVGKWLALELGVWTFLWLVLCIKKRNLSLACFSLINWNVVTMAALLGASRALADPSVPISAREIT
ncbi:Glycosyltransferase, GT2 family [Nitrosospira sp. Nsp11]|uniref:glycosyltransferase n=1 Tax=unclassified Nitrosospira TaxID=2609267 RepID=UPI0008820C4D|nr:MULTISPECIES: glycosyltransferase [unclassified Nitrosospira]SDA25362.1 Glycosyltransferase, GT2 family [Nitrosospira sp. Nsp18]SHM00214.1 Glycosyltransferase, GT2 family [Nitrosospira sp. Nsp11]